MHRIPILVVFSCTIAAAGNAQSNTPATPSGSRMRSVFTSRVPVTQKPSPQQNATPRPQTTAVSPAAMPKFAPVPAIPAPTPTPAPVAANSVPAAASVAEKAVASDSTERLATDDGLAAVDYRKGLLSVVSDHATLDKVLKLVGGKIGATIEISNDLAKEAVVAQLGPASPSEVLRGLLDSPTVDYIIMGGDEVKQVIVRRRQTFGRQPLAMAMPARQASVSTPATEGDPSQQNLNQEPESAGKQPGESNPPR